MDFLEVSAKTVDDAITKACIELGISSDQLEIRVISEGSTGFLGLGSKPAVIQVRRKEVPADVKEEPVPEVSEEPSVEETKEEPAPEPEKKKENRSKKENRKQQKKEKKFEKAEKPASAPVAVPEKKEEKRPVVERTEEEVAGMKDAAIHFLEDVFRSMELPVVITGTYDKEEDALNIDMEGDDMGVLIGKRGQTLDSLQYLTSLVVNKNQKNYVRVKLDTEDYRRRRKDTLENLAKNIAAKVKRTHHSVSLEAMNPYERRIIHSALQNNSYVETHSEGNEPYRHVVVTPKRGGFRD